MKKIFFITTFFVCALCFGLFVFPLSPGLDEEAWASGTHNRVTSVASKNRIAGIVVAESLSESEEYQKLQKEFRRLLEEIKRLEREAKDKFNEEILPIIRRNLKRLQELLEDFKLEDDRSKDDDRIAT